MVINALRDDFVFGINHFEDTPFLQESLFKGNGIGFVARAQAPAVTLPRIKVGARNTNRVKGDVCFILPDQSGRL